MFGTGVLAVLIKFTFPYDWSWTQCLLVGAMMSATDPVATVAVLGQVGTAADRQTDAFFGGYPTCARVMKRGCRRPSAAFARPAWLERPAYGGGFDPDAVSETAMPERRSRL
jgi:Sodium/hydrogen exchanger family